MTTTTEVANGFTRGEIAQCITSRRLHLTILPTEQCNFRCTYCYEDFEIGRMRQEVVNGVKNLIQRRAIDLSELVLSWFGGEPLLALNVVREIARHAHEESRMRGFTLSGGFTTNGYLLSPAVVQEMAEYGQTFYQVSLDGDAEAHNSTRRRADGRGTFDTIWSNLLAVREVKSDFRIQLRIHVTPYNFESLCSLMKKLRCEFGTDPRYYVDFQHIRNMGGAGAANVAHIDEEAVEQITARLWELLGRQTNRSADQPPPEEAAIRDDQRRKPKRTERGTSGVQGHAICYAAKPNHWLIRADGRVGRCTVLLNDPRNDIGSLREDGTLVVDQSKATPWFVGFQNMNPDALACPVEFLPPRTLGSVIPIAVGGA